MAINITATLMKTPLVDAQGNLTREWARAFGADSGSTPVNPEDLADQVTFLTNQDLASDAVPEIIYTAATLNDCTITLPLASEMQGLRKVVYLTAESVHLAVLLPQDGNTIDQASVAYSLSDPRSAVMLEAAGDDWVIVGGFGTLPTPAPADAPNIVAADVTVNFGMWANASVYGFSASIDLPVSRDNLKIIHIQADGVDGDIGTLFGPWVSSPITWTTGDPTILQGEVGVTRVLTFSVENEAGTVTASPLMVSVPVKGSFAVSVSGAETGTRYAALDTRLVHLFLRMVPVLNDDQVPQNVTYWVSQDDGATYLWIGWQVISTVAQAIVVDRLAPGVDENWKVAIHTGAIGGNPTLGTIPAADLPLHTVQSASIPIVALQLPSATDITVLNVTAAGALPNPYDVIDPTTVPQRHYFSIPEISCDDTVCVTDANAFFVRITAQDYGVLGTPVAPESPFAGTQVSETGLVQTFGPLMGDYGTVGLGANRSAAIQFVRLRVYVCNRIDQTGASYLNPLCATLQTGIGSGAGYLDVVVGPSVEVSSVSGSEVGPRYQDSQGGLHTVVSLIPVIAAAQYPCTVTLWLDFGNGVDVWQGWFTLNLAGQAILIGEQSLGSDGIRKSGDIWVPANTAQGTWVVKALPGTVNKGDSNAGAPSATFTVQPVGACLATSVTNAAFVADPVTADKIIYTKWDPGVWYWDYYEVQWTIPSLDTDFNYWFSQISQQWGVETTGTGTVSGGTTFTKTSGAAWTADQVGNDIYIAGVLTTIAARVSGTVITLATAQPNGAGKAFAIWNPEPTAANQDNTTHYPGRVFGNAPQFEGLAANQTAVVSLFGANPAVWEMPLETNPDGSTNIYRTVRFWIYCVSRLGTDSSGSGGAGTYTRQTCWAGGADHYDLAPSTQDAILDLTRSNADTIASPLEGGNGAPITVSAEGITAPYIGPQAVTAQKMHTDAVTAANGALAAAAVVDASVSAPGGAGTGIGINKLNSGTNIFTGDVILSRGASKPIIYLANSGPNGSGIYLFGKADASTGATGLTNQPYVVIQSTGITAFSGGNTSLTVTSSAVTAWAINGSLTDPYTSVSATGVVINGKTSSIAMNSGGFTISDGSGSFFTATSTQLLISRGSNSVLIDASKVRITGTGGATLTIDSLGMAVVKGSSSVAVTASAVTIVNGGSSVAITSSSVAIVNGTLSLNLNGVTTTIDNTAGPFGFAGIKTVLNSSGWTSSVFPGFLYTKIGSDVGILSPTQLEITGLPSISLGSGNLWYDPADGNRVKFTP